VSKARITYDGVINYEVWVDTMDAGGVLDQMLAADLGFVMEMLL